MKTCDVCTLAHPLVACPNGWRPDRNGDLQERAPGLHETARVSVVGQRVARERVVAEKRAAEAT